MPSPQVVAHEPSRRVRKSRKPERREKTAVDLGDQDMETPTPSQQSATAGPGTGAGRERARRVSERMPKTQGAKAKPKSKDTTMMGKNVEKKFLARAEKGKSTEHLVSPKEAISKQPRRAGAKQERRAAKTNGHAKSKSRSKRGAPAAEAAPTQRQVLRGKPQRKRIVRDEGVDAR